MTTTTTRTSDPLTPGSPRDGTTGPSVPPPAGELASGTSPRPDGPTPTPALTRAEAEAVQRELAAKMLSEFSHERLLVPEPRGGEWMVCDDAGAPRWFFTATRHALEHWEVDPTSVRRVPGAGSGDQVDVQQLVLDLRERLGLDETMLPLYLEDLSATLLTAARRAGERAPSSAQLARADLADVERSLGRGHPGFVASNGRVGMGAAQQHRWAPEARHACRLVWLAARRSLCTVALAQGLGHDEHVRLHLLPAERQRFHTAVSAAGEDPGDYTPIPVHPWQWEHRILPGMLPDVLRRDLILVGESEHEWRAQQSVRTFLDVDDPHRDYAKTALGVHSMGFLRGLSPAYMRTMPAISDWLHELVRTDPELAARGIEVLRERSTVGWTGDAHHRSGVGSDHTKQLAALWRESPLPRLSAGEHAASLAGVLHVDRDGTPLVAAWIQRCGTDAETWVRALLEVYLVPVAHLLLAHDVALMPHGENVILRLRDGLPVGAFWKDLGEEMAVLSADRPLPTEIERIRTVVEPESRELSVHTDVLDGVLRHLAVLLHIRDVLDETRFWALAAQVLDTHRAQHPQLWTQLDLFRPTFAHSCLNRLQLRNPHRMVNLEDPAGSLSFAGRLANPLHTGLRYLSV